MNAQNSMLKNNLFTTAVGSAVWWLVGHVFAFGESSGGGFTGITAGASDDLHWFFRWAFAGTVRAQTLAPALVRLLLQGAFLTRS
jgi:ammonia channel protein AmtB